MVALLKEKQSDSVSFDQRRNESINQSIHGLKQKKSLCFVVVVVVPYYTIVFLFYRLVKATAACVGR